MSEQSPESSSEKYKTLCGFFFALGLLSFLIVGFAHGFVTGMITLGVIALALAWAANGVAKDAEDEENNEP